MRFSCGECGQSGDWTGCPVRKPMTCPVRLRMTPGEIAAFEGRTISYVDDGIEIRIALPLKPGALKFARGFLERLLQDSGNT